MGFTYLIGIIVSIFCLGLIDRKYKLAFFYDRPRTIAVIAMLLGFFLIWDIAGVALGIFFKGGSEYTIGFDIMSNIPIEELFFLTLLTYLSLILYRKFSA